MNSENEPTTPDIHSRLDAHIERARDIRETLDILDSTEQKADDLAMADDYPAGFAFGALLRKLRADLLQMLRVEIGLASALFDGDLPQAATAEVVVGVLDERIDAGAVLMEEALGFVYPEENEPTAE